MSCLLIAALFTVAVVFLVRTIAPQTLGEQLRRRLVKQLQNHYQDFDVSIRRGRYEAEIGFIFEGLRITAPRPATRSTPTNDRGRSSPDELTIERLIVLADTKPEKLLDKQSPIVTHRVVVDGLQATTSMQDDGTLSIARLWPPPTMGPGTPRLEVARAQLRILTEAGDSIDIDVADLVVLNHEANDSSPSKRTISLRGTSNFAKSIELTAEHSENGWGLQGIVRHARIYSDLYERLPAPARKQLSAIRGLSCTCDVAFAAQQPAQQPVDYKVKTSIHHGRFEHADLPLPVTQLRGLVVCQPGGITVKACQGSFGDAICRLSGSIEGYGWPSPASLNFSASGLLLSGTLATVLPAKERKKWDRLQPGGRVDVVSARLDHNDGKWAIESTIQCKGVSARLADFPYPVQQLVGKVEIRDGLVTCRGMTGRAGGHRLQCGFQMPVSPSVKGEKLIVVATDGPIAIDNTLIEALSPRAMPESKLEKFVRSLQPRGAVHLVRATFRTDVEGNKSRSIDINVMDGHLRYQSFPYPLYNVKGTIRVEDDLLTLSDFHGVNANAGQILCDGSYLLPKKGSAGAEESDSGLHLRFRGSSIPMDESLRSSLPGSARKTWDAISPGGVLDYLNVVLSQRGADKRLQLSVTAAETEAEQVTNRNLSVQPTALPYRLDITDGLVRYDGSEVVIESVKAQHDVTRISADGGCRRDSAGRWRFALNVHSGSRLDPNPDLIAALPEEMREAMHRLQLRGPVNIRGRTELQLSDDRHPDTTMDWDLVLQLEGNRIGDVGPVHSLRGELSTRGRRDQHGVRGDGFVRLDSMHINDLQITSIRGPYAVRNDRLRLGGAPATSMNNSQVTGRSIQGRLFDGKIDLSGDVVLSSASFDVGVTLQNGRVPTLLADLGQGRSELTGSFSGNLELEGILGTTDLLKGAGSAQVTGANLYQLPLLVQLLNLLRITPTEDVAFTDADVDFNIVEDQINFDDLKLWGDLVSLYGSGTMNWRQELDLTFNTRVSPKTTFSKILQPLGGPKYTLWDVDVHGPLGDPTVELRPLESVGQTFERIFPVKGPRNAQAPGDEDSELRKIFR